MQQASSSRQSLCWRGTLLKVILDPLGQRIEFRIHCQAFALKPPMTIDIANAAWPSIMDVSNPINMDMKAIMTFVKMNNIPVAHITAMPADQLPSGTDGKTHAGLYHAFIQSMTGKGKVNYVPSIQLTKELRLFF